jgi:hypothetical protein
MPESRIPKQVLELQRQFVSFQKQAFDSTFNALSAFQDQQRELMSRFLESAPAVPAEMRELVDEWARALETGREQFRESVDKSFETVESYLERLAGEGEAPSSGAAAKSSGTKAKPRPSAAKE